MSYSELAKLASSDGAEGRATAGEERDARLSLARQKLNKFRKKKATAQDTADNVSETAEELSVSGLSGRSSPSLDSLAGAGAFAGGAPVSAPVLPLSIPTSHIPQPARSVDGASPRASIGENGEMRDLLRQLSQRSNPAEDGLANHRPEVALFSQAGTDEMRETIQRLRQELDRERSSVDSRLLREHHNLREQLNGHIQTIGILVAEKTELQAALTRADHMAKKKAVEAEGYANKLAELRLTLTECERRLNETQMNGEHTSHNFHEQTERYTRQIADLRLVAEQSEKTVETMRDELFEARKKLNLKDAETKRLEQRLSDVESQRVWQRGAADSREQEQVESLQRDKKALEWKVQEYQQEMAALRRDMDALVGRYQAALAQAAAAARPLMPEREDADKAEEAVKENAQLKAQQEALIRENEFLLNSAAQQKSLMDQLQQEKSKLASANQQKSDALQQCEARLHEHSQVIARLTALNEQLAASASDRSSLLASVESDKVALSRAVSQNHELKRLLDGLTVELQQEKEQSYQLRTQADAVASGAPRSPSRSLMHSQTEMAVPVNTPASASSQPQPAAHARAFEGKIRNLEDEMQLYKNRVIQADSEVIYLKNALRIKEEESKLLELTERVGAYKTLEHKFVASMKQNAELQDQVDQLEHVILQLQGETETIGDYIALYQNQRTLQKQRELEKSQQIQRLLEEREAMKLNIAKLSGLLRGRLHEPEVPPHRPHAEVESGDTPDAAVHPAENGHAAGAEADAGAEATILTLLQDMDDLVHTPPSAAGAAPAHRPLHHTPYCPCCVGVLRVV
ncbi:golgin subfamily A member 2-like [Paramacrobiotus metropolitanus]|uniref:golgin subfamily A member 2-like n=1 Tax=Paramacrobiotus metropolitanus TaxID=2943436 RepID=UPI002445CD1C|nr:golgin subfamily A member 2-like [Paramacrobiotus metropolitanus]